MRKNLIVMQDGAFDCGPASLLSVIRYFGGDVSLEKLSEMTKTTKDGTNFYNIQEAAKVFGLSTKSFKLDDLDKIKNLNIPMIVQLKSDNYSHFVVVYKVLEDKIVIMDPAKGKRVINKLDFASAFTGYLMLFEKTKSIICYHNKKILNNIIGTFFLSNIKIIVFLIILSLIFTGLSCFLGLYSEIIFDKVINTNTNNLIIITWFFFILFIVKNITYLIRNHLVIFLNQKLDISIILSTYSKVILLPYHFYKNKTSPEILSRINDLSLVKNFVSKVIVSIFLDFFTFILSFIIIYMINKEILFMLLIINIFYLIVIVVFNRVVKNYTIINQENNAKINNYIIESINSYETVKGLNIEDNMILKFSKIYSQALSNLYDSEKVSNVIALLKESINDIGMLFVNFAEFKFIMENVLTVGNYMTVTFLSGYLIYPMRNIVDILNDYHYVKNSLRRVNNILDIGEEKIYDKEKLTVSGNIKINNLFYTFNNRDNVLKGINLFMRDSERVLFMGKSGSGKSTILKLLYKYHPVDRGMIFIDGYDLNDYAISDIRKNITYVSQNEFLFSGSIRDNILLGRTVREVDYLNVCKLTYIDDIVKNSILGYEYLLEENGVNLSGGQRQRIILARSLLKESKIIMLDEALCQIDSVMEREILINIFNYFYDKTFIVISHRKENSDLYDRIIKINNGIVCEMEEMKR